MLSNVFHWLKHFPGVSIKRHWHSSVKINSGLKNYGTLNINYITASLLQSHTNAKESFCYHDTCDGARALWWSVWLLTVAKIEDHGPYLLRSQIVGATLLFLANRLQIACGFCALQIPSLWLFSPWNTASAKWGLQVSVEEANKLFSELQKRNWSLL